MKITIIKNRHTIPPETFDKILQWVRKLKCEMRQTENLDEKLKILQSCINLNKAVCRHLTQKVESEQKLIENRERKLLKIRSFCD